MKTQKSILIFVLLNLNFLPALFAQEKFDLRETTKHHEISIGVADLFSKQEPVYYYPLYAYDMAMPYYPYYYESSSTPKLALRYKYNFGRLALRAGFDFAYMDRENHYEENELENKYSHIYGNYKLGAEFHTDHKRVQFIFGMDLFYVNSDSKNQYESENTIWVNEEYVTQTTDNENTNTYTEYGVSPLVGIKYFFNENLSLGVETNYFVGYYKNETKNKYNEETSKYWNDGINTRFGPIGILSLNIHF